MVLKTASIANKKNEIYAVFRRLPFPLECFEPFFECGLEANIGSCDNPTKYTDVYVSKFTFLRNFADENTDKIKINLKKIKKLAIKIIFKKI